MGEDSQENFERASVLNTDLMDLLTRSLDTLNQVGCQYPSMCDGWECPPVQMATCPACWMIRDILQSGLVPTPDWAKDVEILDYKPHFAIQAYDSNEKLKAGISGGRRSGFETYGAAQEWALDLLAEGAWVVFVEAFRGKGHAYESVTTLFWTDLQRERNL